MTIAYDAISNPTPGTGNLSWTHTPVGTPRGIVVWIVCGTAGDDQVTSVTYGGNAMTEVTGSPALKVTGEADGVYCYVLLSSVPTGAQTVSVTVSGSGGKAAVCVSLTAAADLEVQDTDATINIASISNPTATLSLGGFECWCGEAFFSGRQTVTFNTPLTNWTERYNHDYGTATMGCYTYNIVGTADVTMGFNNDTADDATVIGVALKEVVIPQTPIVEQPQIDEDYEEQHFTIDHIAWLTPEDVLPPEELIGRDSQIPIDETYEEEHDFNGWQQGPLLEDFIEPQVAQAENPAIDETYEEEHDYAGLAAWQAPENIEDFQALAELAQVDETYEAEYDYAGWTVWVTPDDIAEPYIQSEATQIDEAYDEEHDHAGWQTWITPEDIQDFQALAELAQVDETYEAEYDYAGWPFWITPEEVIEPYIQPEATQIDESYIDAEPVDFTGWQAWVTPENVEEPGIALYWPQVDEAYMLAHEYGGWRDWQAPADVITVFHPDPDDIAWVRWKEKRNTIEWQEKRAEVGWRDKRKLNE